MRAASPSCCRPARRSTSITCRAAISSTRCRRWLPCARRGWSRCRISPPAASPRASRCSPSCSGAVKTAGVGKVLLIGGDVAEAAGPYADRGGAAARRLLADCGIQQVGLAGYPEGHPRIATATLRAALDEKLALAREQGLAAYVVTQFCVRAQPHRRVLRRPGPARARCAGLCRPRRARRTRSPCCAMRSAAASAPRCAPCSRKAWGRCGSSRMPIRASSSPRWPAIAAAAAPANVVGVHLYSFGGVARTARWMNERITARCG